MPKGFIITDMPKSCFYCDYCHERDYNSNYQIEGSKFCGLENIEVNDFYYHENLRRPNWCPIREIDSFTKGIGLTILFLLQNSDITCEELAEKLNYSYKDMCRIFSGELMLPPKEIQKIAEVFGTTKHDLMNRCI